MMEASTVPRHFMKNQQQSPKYTGSSIYQYAREKCTKPKDPAKRFYESKDYPYPSHERRATTLPSLDQRITELDNDDSDTVEEIVTQARVENQREVASSLGDVMRDTTMQPSTSELNSHVRNGLTREGETRPQPGLRYAMSGALSSEYERGGAERKVISQFEDEENIYDAYPVTNNTSHNIAAASARLDEANGNQQPQRAQSWDSRPRLPLFVPTLHIPFNAQAFFNINHVNPLFPIQSHVRNVHGLDLMAQTAICQPQIYTPALWSQNVRPIDSTRLQAEYLYLASEVAMNRDMQQEDISVLAAGPLYPQHVHVHASHELRQLQTLEHALLDAIEDIKAEIETVNESSARAQSIDRENVQEPRAQWGRDSKKKAGVKKLRFEELDLEDLTLEEDKHDEAGGSSKGNGRRWRRLSNVVLGTFHEVDYSDDIEEISKETKGLSQESGKGRLRF